MKTFSLSPGLVVSKDGVLFEFNRPFQDQLLFSAPLTGEPWTPTLEEFQQAYLAMAINVVSARTSNSVTTQKSNAVSQPSDSSPIAYSKQSLDRCDWRASYVEAALKAGITHGQRLALRALAKRVWLSHADRDAVLGYTSPPSAESIGHWIKLYEESGHDKLSLADQPNRSGRPLADGPLREIIEDSIDEIYLTEERKPAVDVLTRAKNLIDEHNLRVTPSQQLSYPDVTTIRRYIRLRNKFEVTEARHGRKEALRRFRSVKHVGFTSRTLERCEIDHCVADFFVVDDSLLVVLGRPRITVCRDQYSGMPLGISISFGEDSLQSVFACLRQAMLPKDAFNRRFPSIKNGWPAYGIPETLVMDNAPQFHSKDLRYAALQLGMSLEYCKAYQPWLKGGVERFIKEQNAFLHKLPGTTFSGPIERGDYKSEDRAAIRYSVFLEIFYKWVIDIYMRKPIRGKGVPIKLWEEGARCIPPALPCSIDDLSVILSHSRSGTLRHDGIRFVELNYNSPDLDELRYHRGEKLEVEYKYDTSTIAHIWVKDPRNSRYIKVPCLQTKYCEGKSLAQHNLIRRVAKEELKLRIDEKALRQAEEFIREKIAAEVAHTAKARRKTARGMSAFETSALLAGGKPPSVADVFDSGRPDDVSSLTYGDDIPTFDTETAQRGGL